VLGNKWAGRHNLKTVYFKETLVLGYFLGWSSAICVFFAAIHLPQDGSGETLHAFLEGALGQKALCQQ
jgi:hypothetical protein